MALTGSQQLRRAKFPLLKLPAELRNKIYNRALGGHVFHIGCPRGSGEDGKGVKAYLCCATISDSESVSNHGNKAKILPQELRFFMRHEQCFKKPARPTVNSPLLRVCKQIRKEAALIVISANHFAFGSSMSLKQFCRNLTAAQQKAIQSVILYQQSTWTGWMPKLHTSLALHEMHGLRRISIFIDLCPSNLHEGYFKLPPLTSVDAQDERLSSLCLLRAPMLKHVDVLINNTGNVPQDEQVRTLEGVELQQWATRIKKMLLSTELGHNLQELDEDSEVAKPINEPV